MAKSTLLALCFAFLTLNGFCQGVELVPESEYEKIPSPPIEAGAPESDSEYSIPTSFFPPPGKQGQDYSCVGWAVGYAYESFYHTSKNVSNSHDWLRFSPWYVYKSIKACTDCKCGTRVDLALNFLRDYGNVPFNKCPYDVTNCRLPESDLKNTASKYKVPDWRRVEDKLNIGEIKSYLRNNIPVIAVIKADNRFKGYKDPNEHEPYEWRGTDSYEYHAVLITGYSDSKKAIKLLNSYGTAWGTGGYGWITYEAYRQMIKEAYVIQKDYSAPLALSAAVWKDDETIVGAPSGIDMSSIKASDFRIHGRSESVRTGRYHFTFSIDAKPEVLSCIRKVVYFYDDNSFINKLSTSYKAPSFPNAYDGWGCVPKMVASIYLLNDSIVKLPFDGCLAINNPSIKSKSDPASVEIVPFVTVESGLRNYHFNFELRGIEPVKSLVDSVSYFWNHSSFKYPVTTVKVGDSNFASGYTGWGCLQNMHIVIYFKNRTTKTMTLNMCDQLGWADIPNKYGKVGYNDAPNRNYKQ